MYAVSRHCRPPSRHSLWLEREEDWFVLAMIKSKHLNEELETKDGLDGKPFAQKGEVAVSRTGVDGRMSARD